MNEHSPGSRSRLDFSRDVGDGGRPGGRIDDPALARLVTMTTGQVRDARTATALDAGLCLLLAAVEQTERRADPSGDPERWRAVACYAVSSAITAGAAARLSGCAR